MKISSFDGGLSLRVDESLAVPNEAVMYTNINNEKIVLQSIKDVQNLDIEVRGFFYNFNDEWLNSTAARSYVEFNNFLYYSEEGKAARKYNGFQNSLLGIEGPVNPITSVQANPSGSEKIKDSEVTLQYTYTYYNIEDGIESTPAPISDELVLDADKVVDLSAFDVSTDPQVTHIRVYRIGDSITTMTLVLEVDNVAATLRDDIPTIDLIGTILETYSNFPAPVGARYLVEAYGILFCAVGNKVYFSEIGFPDYWPTENYIQFAKTITGIFPIPEGVLVQSRYTTFMIIGTTAADFRKVPISFEQGNINHLSNKMLKNVPIWLSTDGFCSYENGSVNVISRDKLGKLNIDIVNTVVYDEVYYAVKTDGTILAMDARFNVIFKNISVTGHVQNIAVANDNLYVGINEKLNTLFEGLDLPFTYMSPLFVEDSHSTTKLYNNIYIRSDGEFEVRVFIDKAEVFNRTLTGNKVHEIKVPAEKQRGSNIQFYITGVGTVYEYEYKVVGRQNGR